MSPLTSRSEGVGLRPFSGLQNLEDYIDENVVLHVQSNVGLDDIPSGAWLELEGSDIYRLGLTLKLKSADKLRGLVSPIVMDIADVDVIVVAIDRSASILRESVVLANLKLTDLRDEVPISQSGIDAPHRILSNKFSGFRVEVALVQNKDVLGNNPTKPRSKGSLIAKAFWEVKPVLSGDVIQPEELTEASRESLGLTKDSWVYFEAKPALFTATAFGEALGFHVDKSLLGQIQLLTAESSVLAEMLLYSNAVIQLIYEMSLFLNSAELTRVEDGSDIEAYVQQSESQGMRLMRVKFPKRDDQEIRELIRDDPARAVAEFLGNAKDLKSLMSAMTAMNGGSNELPDFEDE